MDTRPAVSQADRELIEDFGLSDVLERVEDPQLLHVDEKQAS